MGETLPLPLPLTQSFLTPLAHKRVTLGGLQLSHPHPHCSGTQPVPKTLPLLRGSALRSEQSGKHGASLLW